MMYELNDDNWLPFILFIIGVLLLAAFVGNLTSTDYMFNNCIVTDMNGKQACGRVDASECKISVTDAKGIKVIMPKEAVAKIEVIESKPE